MSDVSTAFVSRMAQVKALQAEELRELARSENTHYARWSKADEIMQKHDISDLDTAYALRNATEEGREIIHMQSKLIMVGADADDRRLKMTVSANNNTIELFDMEILEE